MSFFRTIKERAGRLHNETYALYFVYKDKRTPWYTRILLISVVGYALTPVDLIPDFIPVLGYLDDLIIIPLGIILSLKTIPNEVISEARERAGRQPVPGKIKWAGLGIVLFIWLICLAVISFIIFKNVVL